MHTKLGKNVGHLFLTTLAVCFILVLTFLNINNSLNKNVEVLGIKTSPENERVYWKNIVEENPTYRDGFIELARIETEMGEQEASNKALDKAKLIDPNSVNLLRVERELLSSK